MDFGYPQFTEAKILSEYIKTDAHKMEVRYSTTALLTSLDWCPASSLLLAEEWRHTGLCQNCLCNEK